jgi:hypothetical protein
MWELGATPALSAGRAPHLVVDVELIHMAAVDEEADEKRLDVDMHAFEFPRLVVAALIAVKREVAKSLENAVVRVCVQNVGRSPNKDLHARGDLSGGNQVQSRAWSCMGRKLGLSRMRSVGVSRHAHLVLV